MEIVNTTVCAVASTRINLSLLTSCSSMRTFDAVRLKLHGVTFIIFGSGKINCLAAVSLEQARKCFKKLRHKLCKELKLRVDILNVTLKNVVAHYSLLPAPLDLVTIFNFWKNHGIKGCVYYEPELYPAVKIKLSLGTVLVYHTGKVLLTGVKDINHLAPLYNMINCTIDKLLGPHTVVMGNKAIKKMDKLDESFNQKSIKTKTIKSKVKPSVDDDVTRMLEAIMAEVCPEPKMATPLPPTTLSFNICQTCANLIGGKTKTWRKRKGNHQATLTLCPACFKSNCKVFRSVNRCNPAVADHIDGPNCPCWKVPLPNLQGTGTMALGFDCSQAL